MARFIFRFLSGAMLALAVAAVAQNVPRRARAPSDDSAARGASATEGDSSSKSTKVDLAPPPGEAGLNLDPGGSPDGRSGQELPPWNPLKADKNVEIGDFYYHRGNYEAAISRYREALQWQDNHALATFRLAEALEHVGQYAAARQSYARYLQILPKGNYARAATQALQRLKDEKDKPQEPSPARLPD